MRRLLPALVFLAAAPFAHAVCPAAPVGSMQDTVIRMKASDGVAGIGPAANMVSNTEGTLVYDSATKQVKVCDGDDWVEVSGGGDGGGDTDRIVSGTADRTRIVAISSTSHISITQGGTDTAWFDPTRGLAALGVSTTGTISGSSGYFAGNVGIGTGNPRSAMDVNGLLTVDSTNAPWPGTAISVTTNSLSAQLLVGHNSLLSTQIRLGPHHDGANQLNGLTFSGGGGIAARNNAKRVQLWGVDEWDGSGGVDIIAHTFPSIMVRDPLNTFGVAITLGQGTGISGGSSGELTDLAISPSISLTGDGDVVYRGFHYRPTLSITNPNAIHRAIETERGDVIFGSTSGNVGVGTQWPSATLHVSGSISASGVIQVGTYGACTSGIPGAIRYNSGNIQFCNGSVWTSVGGPWLETVGSGTGTLIPIMTAPHTAGVSITASSIYSGAWPAWYVGDNVGGHWVKGNDGNDDGWVQAELASARAATKYSLRACTSSSSRHRYAPKTWTFQGSNNGSSWTTLDTRSNVDNWTSLEEREYSFSNDTAYKFYRVDITLTELETSICLDNLQIFEDEPIVYVPEGVLVGIGTPTPDQGRIEVKFGTVCVDTNGDNNATSCIADESDERLKRNIRPLQGSLDILSKLRGVSFDWRVSDSEVLRHYPLISRFVQRPQSVGVIAQEVEKVFPLAIDLETVGDGGVQYKQVDYGKFVPLLIEAVKELKAANDNQARAIEELRTEVRSLRSAGVR